MPFNKLVRDKIPEMIVADGHSVNELLSVYQKKHDARGGFSKKIFLIVKE